MTLNLEDPRCEKTVDSLLPAVLNLGKRGPGGVKGRGRTFRLQPRYRQL
jgi:hypothetical protein